MIDNELPELIAKFCKEQEGRWSNCTLQSIKYSLFSLHQWMTRYSLSYSEIIYNDIQKFIECPNENRQCISSQKITLTRLRPFFVWLRNHQELKLEFDKLFPISIVHVKESVPESVVQFCEERKAHWAPETLRLANYTAFSLHRWMKVYGFTWQDLSPEKIDTFFKKPHRRQNKCGSYKITRRYTCHYLQWMYEINLLDVAPGTILGRFQIHFSVSSKRFPTPDTVTRFIRARKKKGWGDRADKYQHLLKHFHVWLEKQGFKLPDVGDETLDEYLSYAKNRGTSHRYRQVARRCLINYLGWLNQIGKIKLSDPALLKPLEKPHHHLPSRLPRYANEFLDFLSINLKPNSVSNYQDSLRHFHVFLRRTKISPRKLKRKHLELFMSSLKKRELSAIWRKKILVCTRTYLFWLNERGIVSESGDTLLRASDLPKLPFYLPRPLPPEVDAELIARLSKSDEVLELALLLMRHAGLRISELRALDEDCLRTDHMGRHFLKVPLGKLNNERMVPLMTESVALIAQIKKMSAKNLLQNGILKSPERLIYGLTGRNPDNAEFRVALLDACRGMKLKESITTHQLRHTCATSLLNAGMSLAAIMRLLGHKSTGMTLRYAAVSPETVRKEFEAAMASMERRHKIQVQIKPLLYSSGTNIDGCFSELMQVIRVAADGREDRQLTLVVKRLHRLKHELNHLFKTNPLP